MKKVLYNKYAKLLEMICILAAVGVLLYQGIDFEGWLVKRQEAYNEIYNKYVNKTVYEEVKTELIDYLDSIILVYKNMGMEGVENYYRNNTNNIMDNLNLIIKDNDDSLLLPTVYTIVDYWDNVQEYDWNTDGTFMKIWVKDIIQLVEYDETLDDFVDRQYQLSNVLSNEAVQYLSEINYELEIKVNAKGYYVNKKYETRKNLAQEEFNNSYSIEDEIYRRLNTFIACGVLIIFATILLAASCGRQTDGNKELNYWEKGYCEVHIIIAGVTLASGALGAILFYSRYDEFLPKYLDYINVGFVIGILLAVIIFYYEVGVIIKKLINKRFIKDWLVVRILLRIKKKTVMWLKKIAAWNKKVWSEGKTGFKRIYDKSAYKALPEIKKLYTKKVWADIAVILTDIVVVFLIIMIISEGWISDLVKSVSIVTLLALLILNVVYAVLSIKEYKHLRIYNKISEKIDNIYNGRYGQTEEVYGEDNEILNQVANLSENFKKSVEKQVEAEKMQIELVANVSHDLKTPLTSIISYVDLLSKEELSPVARDYVKILEDKSARLKDIVADVFDLAKATSGEKVTLEQLDGVVLINQVLSDMSDKIEDSGKDLRVKISADTAPVTGNGQKLYRVFQNVIDNALKYSMPGTRIFLSAEQTAGEFKVIIKNISEYEIDYTEQEILSRFTRGDKARHSEGNGLGLSIAKSFTELCGGTFEVKLDDDLFKVIIVLR